MTADIIKQKLQTLKSSFTIQAGHPTALYLKQQRFEKVADIFPKLFGENDEAAFLFWCKIPIRFAYAYEWYANFDDLLIWFERMLTKEKGDYEFVLTTDIFLTTMKARWEKGMLTIESDWTAKRSHEKMADVLNQKGTIRLKLPDFLSEWKILWMQIEKAIRKVGVALADEKEQQKLQTIQLIISHIQGQGKMYTA